MFKYALAAVWSALIIMKLAAVPSIVGISWWIIAPLPLYVIFGLWVVFFTIGALACFGLSGHQKKLEKKAKKPFEYPRG